MEKVVVLIVDDEFIFRERLLPGLASDALDELRKDSQIGGFEIKKASCPEEARGLIAEEVPHLLISEYMFPGSEEMGGDLVRWFAKEYPDKHAILVSGKTMAPELKRAVEQGRPNVTAIHKKGNNAGVIDAIKKALSG